MIIGLDPSKYMNKFKEEFVIRNVEKDPTEYLGTQWGKTMNGKRFINMRKYIKESIRIVEKEFGKLREEKVPMVAKSHPELDETMFLDEEGKRKYQSLLGILTWIYSSLRMDISYSVNSLSRFQANPGEGHLKEVLRIFGFLKKYPERGIRIDHHPIEGQPDFVTTQIDFGHQYEDCEEELDPNFPPALMGEIKTTVFVDSDHGHDKRTGRSITEFVGLFGSTPGSWGSKRQSSVQASTFGAEFLALK